MMQVTAPSEFTASRPRVGGLAGPSSPAQAFFCPLVSWPGPSLRMPWLPRNRFTLFLIQMAVSWGSLWEGHNLG